MEIQLLDEAIAEIVAVASDYDRLHAGLGAAIVDEIEAKLTYVNEYPFSYQSVGA